ncbi:MAG: oligosaccharide flippase family protein [Burkholderiaceae bacterium]
MAGLKRALIFSVLTQHSMMLLTIVTTAVIARLLTPAEIGVFAVASAATYLAIELRSLGVGQYLIREAEIGPEKIRSALGLLVVMSWGMGLLIALICWPVAQFYSEPALMPILLIIASTFLFAPFGAVPFALLSRELAFDTLFRVKAFHSVLQLGSTMLLIWQGWSYYGLAWGFWIGSLAETAALLWLRPPGTPFKPSFVGLGKLMRFGVFVSVSNMFNQFAENMPDLVLGRVANMASVGLFSRGFGLALFLHKVIVMAVQPVVLPHLSNVKRQGASVGHAYLDAVNLQLAFSLPVFAVAGAAAFALIRALFGDQWDASVPIASVMAIWGMFMSVHFHAASLLMAIGRERVLMWVELAVFLVRVICVIAAAPQGLIAVAWGMVASGVFEFALKSLVLRGMIEMPLRALAAVLVPNLLLAALCWSVLWAIDVTLYDLHGSNPWPTVLVVAVSMTLTWLIGLRLLRHRAWGIAMDMAAKVLPAGLVAALR